MQKKNVIFLGVIILVVFAVVLGVRFFSGEDDWICEKGEWIKHGNPSAPQPISGCGSDPVGMKPRDNAEIQEKYATEDKIKVAFPKENDEVASPVEITGEARGTWYFEGSFPVRIEDKNGNLLGQGIAYAQGEWMTENYVPFHCVAIFSPKGNVGGFVVLNKNNPSDLEEYDEAVKIPVRF